MLDTLSVPAFLEWLASTTLLTRLPEAQRQNLNALLPTILNSDDEQAFATIASFFHEMTHQRYVIPLLHHWMEFATEKSFTWRDLNTLGWPDLANFGSNKATPAKGPLKAFKGKGEKCEIWGGGNVWSSVWAIPSNPSAAPFTVYRYLHSERPIDEAKMPMIIVEAAKLL